MRLLIAEDDTRLLKSLLHIFKIENYSVEGVSNGRDAYDYALDGGYDGLILDIMMPEMDGIEVLRKLRQHGITTPALFLTARTEVEQRVEGLDAGADDYLPKPFETSELLARVRAMLRRKENYVHDLLTYKELILNRSTYELSYQGQSQPLSGKEFQLMEYLLQKPEFIVTTDELMSKVWGWNNDVDVSVVWVHLSNVRKKLATLHAPVEIRYVRNAGYILEGKK